MKCVYWKKITQRKSCELSFIWDLTEANSLRDNLSDSFEQLWEVREEPEYIYELFCWEKTCTKRSKEHC